MKTIVSDIPERSDFLSGKKTIEIGYPWVTPGAIIALEEIVNKDFLVIECGCGGSTIFYAKRCKSILSLESDYRWINEVKNATKDLNNVEILYLQETEKFLEVINQQKDNYYDLVSIDSKPKHTNRLSLANAAVSKIKLGGWLVLDNYNFFSLENFSYPHRWNIYTYDDFGWRGKGTRICKRTR